MRQLFINQLLHMHLRHQLLLLLCGVGAAEQQIPPHGGAASGNGFQLLGVEVIAQRFSGSTTVIQNDSGKLEMN